ncbi:MAG: aminotransferase [Verrucomicrobiales bacterium]|nr:aminotransferase [Verrucomicrobiales bacterium]
MHYFDYNATSPLIPVARDAWLAANNEFSGNPSSLHRSGRRAEHALENARAELAEILGCVSSEIIWTSGATESANLVIHQLSTYETTRSIFISSIEHPCIFDSAKGALGDRLRVIPVTSKGVIDLVALTSQAVKENPAAIILMAANNETGVIQPWEVIRDFCLKHGILFICDAVQLLGKLPCDGLGKCDFVFASGHKFGAPKGVGFLKMPARFPFKPLFVGGKQEFGFRAGTENVPGVLAFMAALRERQMTIFHGGGEAQTLLKIEAMNLLSKALPEATLISDAPALWNTGTFLMPEFDCRKRWVV